MKKNKLFLALICLSVLLLTVIILISVFSVKTRWHTGEEFGIEKIKSPVDFDRDGRDDYADILRGARRDAERKPTYDGRYWTDAYPPENIGVCTDVVWRAFREAGYSLRLMVDYDAKANPACYPNITKPDNNIDFRRVKNLKVFFSRYAESLTLDISEIAEWQAGDIVVFGESHIGIVSDRRDADGVPYIIHNGGGNQKEREEPFLGKMALSGHYRFNAESLPAELFIEFDG